MKKIVTILVLSILALTSCGTKKFEELPTEKKDEIVKQVEEKRVEKIEKIDTNPYTNEANLNAENLSKLESQMEEINKSVIEDVKKAEGVDLSEIEKRISSDNTNQ